MPGVCFGGRSLVALAAAFFIVAFATNSQADAPKEGPAVEDDVIILGYE